MKRSVLIKLESGLQARQAAQFVQEANQFSSELFLEKNEKRVNAKSIMGLMSLAIAEGETITIIADGSDEESALDHLETFVSSE